MRCIPAILLTILMLSSAVIIVSDYSAAEGELYHDGKFTFILDSSGNAILTDYDNKDPEQNVIIHSPLTAKENHQSYTLVEIRNGFTSPVIESISIPSSVTTIGREAFNGASGIKRFIVDGGTNFRVDANDVLYTYDWHRLIRFPSNSSVTDYTIHPETSEIFESAFFGSNKLTSVTFDNNLIKISDGAFVKCTNLATVNFNPSLSVIGNSAFYNCTSLTSVTLPDTLILIGNHAFYKSGLSGTVNIPYGVEFIGDAAFADCSNLTGFTSDNYRYPAPTQGDDSGILFKGGDDNRSIICYPSNRSATEYTIPAKSGIEPNAFEGCVNLKTIHLPNDYTSIPEMSFYGCSSLEKIDIEKISVIGAFAFFNCTKMTSIDFSDKLLVIGECAFMMSGLTKLDIPSNVVTVNSLAFSGCSSLTEVTVAESSKATFKEDVFSADFNLKTITINSKDVTLSEYSLDIGNYDTHATVDVYVKHGYSLPSGVSGNNTTLNVKVIGERPYPWVNIIGAVVCAIGIIGILYGMRQV